MAEEARPVTSIVGSIFARPALDVDAVLKLRNAARNSAAERSAFQDLLKNPAGELPKEELALRQAAYSWGVGRLEDADAALKNVGGIHARLIRGGVQVERCARESGSQYVCRPAAASAPLAQAITDLQAVVEAAPKSALAAAEYAGALRYAGKTHEALAVVDTALKSAPNDSDLLYYRGTCLEAEGRWRDACELFEKSLAADPQNANSKFRLAYYMDMRGLDPESIEAFKPLAEQGFANAMVNLALLYEDNDDLDSAISCLKDALRADPTNERAQLFLRDAVESLDMYYDESQRKESDRLEAVLRIPVNDFELSVRSRNCLAKMNVKTLADLVRKTEAELLAYKNFGETSLREIKQLLESKGLRLGMHKEEEQKRARVQRMRLGNTENPSLAKSITDLELSVRSRKCMQRLNIETVGDLCEKSEADLLATKNFGQTSLNEIKTKLAELNLSLKTAE